MTASTSSILIISGLPGAGKSHYGKWLQRHGWGRVCHDQLDQSVPLDRGWIQAYHGHDEPLLAAAASCNYPAVVVEWGFEPQVDFARLKNVLGRGYNGWYFDGDRQAALVGWRKSWQGMQTDGTWRSQVAKLDAIWPQLQELYGDRIVMTVSPGPTYLPELELHRVVGVSPP